MNPSQDLKKAGLKATVPRLKILDVFTRGEGRHYTAEEVYKHLIGEGEEIGLATVYRVLTQFEHAGLLSRRHFDTEKAVFEFNTGDHHDHLVCIQCGKVVEFFDPVIEKRQAEIAEEHGFKVRDHALNLYVECLDDGCPGKQGR